MVTHITFDDLEALALGCAVLGSGGGSNPTIGKEFAKQALSRYGSVPVMSIDEIDDTALIVPVSYMGAPPIAGVKKPTGKEFIKLLELVEKHYRTRPQAIIAAEIGGSNGFSPLLCAGALGVAIIDGDTIGRAFPELHMASTTLHGISNTPAFLSGVDGTTMSVHTIGSDQSLEQIARTITIALGSKAALVSDIMTGKEAKKAIIKGSYTRALELGKSIMHARQEKKDVAKILEEKAGATIIFEGTITAVERSLMNGFVIGYFNVKNTADTLVVHFKNENLFATCCGEILAATPSIIMPIDKNSGLPLTVEALAPDKKISVISLAADPLWSSPDGLALVGPEAFGYSK